MNSCFAIICSRDKILLFLRDNKPDIPYPNHWHLPGGGRGDGESPREAIERELKEEVSHIPKKLKLLGIFVKENGTDTHVYTAFVDNHEARLFKHGKGEGQKIRFFTINEMTKLKLTPLIDKYLTTHKKEFNDALKKKSFAKFPFRNLQQFYNTHNEN
ncbi:NUDIX domain-containing protein [Patescibacteria group bacterium]|nr:NUDIX domain-containing protein [Patescibacteria group bacterium]